VYVALAKVAAALFRPLVFLIQRREAVRRRELGALVVAEEADDILAEGRVLDLTFGRPEAGEPALLLHVLGYLKTTGYAR
jgi:hypothetical protein